MTAPSDDAQAPLEAAWQQEWHRLNEQPPFRRFVPTNLRAAWWAARSVRRARRELKRGGVAARVGPPPDVPWGARSGVYGVLNRLDPTCIERCLVQQAWLRAFDIDRSVVIGVRTDGQAFRAHAWIEDMVHPAETAQYRIIHRIAPE